MRLISIFRDRIMNPSQYVVNAMREPNDDNFVGLDEFEDIILSSQSLFQTQQNHQDDGSAAIRFDFQEFNTDGSMDSSQRLQQQSLPDRCSELDSELIGYRNLTQENFKNCK